MSHLKHHLKASKFEEKTAGVLNKATNSMFLVILI